MSKAFFRKSGLSITLAFLAIGMLAGTLLACKFAIDSLRQDSRAQFIAVTDQATAQLMRRLNSYDTLLYTTRTLLNEKPDINQSEWDHYFKNNGDFKRYEGVSAIVYATYDAEDSGPRITSRLFSSYNDLSALHGVNIYHLTGRKDIYDQAVRTGKPTASGPLTLATGVHGLTITLPVFRQGQSGPAGFIIISFRINNLLPAIFPTNSRITGYTVSDITQQTDPKHIYSTPNWRNDLPYQRTSTLSAGNRNWQLTLGMQQSPSERLLHRGLPLLVLVTGLTLSGLAVYGLMKLQRSEKARA